MSGLIAVTGATGAVGGRVARALAERGLAQRLIVRDADRAPRLDGAEIALSPGYHDRASLTEALRGAETMFMVSGRESATRVEEHFSAIDAAVEAGVQRIVYTSFLGAAPDATFTLGRQHWATEEHIRSTGLAHTFLRDNLYLDFVPWFFGADGVLAAPAGDGRLAAVSRDDVADVAVAVLTESAHDGQAYGLTGPQAFTLAEAAAEVGRFARRELKYVPETIEEAYASRAHYGAPQFEVEGWVTSYVAIAVGEMAPVTDTVERITGHPPVSLRGLLERDPTLVDHLRGAA